MKSLKAERAKGRPLLARTPHPRRPLSVSLRSSNGLRLIYLRKLLGSSGGVWPIIFYTVAPPQSSTAQKAVALSGSVRSSRPGRAARSARRTTSS